MKKLIFPIMMGLLTQLDNHLTANQLPNFSLVMLNLCNSAHDCASEAAYAWFNDMVTKLQFSPTSLGIRSL